MSFASFSNFLADLAAGNTLFSVFQKNSANSGASAAARWHEWYTANGIPGPGSLTGSAGTGTQIKQSVQGAGINIGAAVSPASRHILSMQVFSPTATLVPAVALLCDFLVHWPSCVVTGTPTALTAAALPRYTDGIGVMALASVQSAFGAAAPALTLTCTYSDDSSAVGGVLTAPAVSAVTTTLLASAGHPFMRLPVGKVGIKAITSYALASGTTGTAALFLVKPLAMMPVLAQYQACERDCVVQLPSIPQVYDDAHLCWITLVGGSLIANAAFGGGVGFAWG